MHKLLTVGFVSMMCLSVMADILALREALSNVVASVDKDDLFTFNIGEIGGQHICRHPSYQALASLVSNDWQNIVGNVGNIATNQTERYLLLATGFQYGWDFHLLSSRKLRTNVLSATYRATKLRGLKHIQQNPDLSSSCIIEIRSQR